MSCIRYSLLVVVLVLVLASSIRASNTNKRVAATRHSRRYAIGQRRNGDECVVYNVTKNAVEPSRRQLSHKKFQVETEQIITYVEATDKSNRRASYRPRRTRGGLGQSFVAILFENGRGLSIKYRVKICSVRPAEGSRIETSTEESSSADPTRTTTTKIPEIASAPTTTTTTEIPEIAPAPTTTTTTKVPEISWVDLSENEILGQDLLFNSYTTESDSPDLARLDDF